MVLRLPLVVLPVSCVQKYEGKIVCRPRKVSQTALHINPPPIKLNRARRAADAPLRQPASRASFGRLGRGTSAPLGHICAECRPRAFVLDYLTGSQPVSVEIAI